jgi:hypothetical protein
MHRVNTSYVTKVVEKTAIITCKKLSSLNFVCYGQPSLKNSKSHWFYLAHNTLLGLNELKYSVPTVNVFVHVSLCS